MVRFPIETYPKGEFDPSEPRDEVKYHPKWADWMVPKPPRIIEICPGTFVYIAPNKPKKIQLGKEIPADEEWIKPFKNYQGDDPNTARDEQEWANTNHQFNFKARPTTGMLPYVQPSKLPEHHNQSAHRLTTRAINMKGNNNPRLPISPQSSIRTEQESRDRHEDSKLVQAKANENNKPTTGKKKSKTDQESNSKTNPTKNQKKH